MVKSTEHEEASRNKAGKSGKRPRGSQKLWTSTSTKKKSDPARRIGQGVQDIPREQKPYFKRIIRRPDPGEHVKMPCRLRSGRERYQKVTPTEQCGLGGSKKRNGRSGNRFSLKDLLGTGGGIREFKKW